MADWDTTANIGTYDEAATAAAKNIAVTRTVTAERIETLSGLVKKNAAALANKVISAGGG